MRKVYVIGTLHTMMPEARAELEKVLHNIDPDQILVEVVDQDLSLKSLRRYPKEMAYAYRWGTRRKKTVCGFDVRMSTLADLSPRQQRALLRKDAKAYRRFQGPHGWKELNKKAYDMYGNELKKQLLDAKKRRAREEKMLKNIRKIMSRKGRVLILTGSAHLPFFEQHLLGAIFPFRC